MQKASQKNEVNDKFYISCKSIFIIILFQLLFVNASWSQNDSLENNPKTSISTDSLRFTKNEFIWGDYPRYTINGSMPLRKSEVKIIPTLAIATGLSAVFYAQHQYQANTIWNERGEFRIWEDGQYALYADKPGHVFGCYFTSYLLSEALLQSGFSWEASHIWGGILGIAYSSYVEVLDGYGVNWGFSPSDFAANLVGAGFYMFQFYYPYLQNFTPKFGYVPPEWHGYRDRVPSDMFIDNYSAHSLWLSVNLQGALPENIGKHIPSWLELSFGYAARNLCDPLNPNNDCSHAYPFNNIIYGEPKFIIALDYNLTKMIPESEYGFVNWFVQTLNHFKLPSPAVEFSPTGTRYFFLYPF